MRIFAVVNQKGGCGKTTTAINLAGVFAARGFRSLLVDMDPQGHCAAGLAIPEQRIDLHIGDAMLADDAHPIDPARLFWRAVRNLDLAPSTLRLAALEAPRGELAGKPDAERRLKKFLARFDSQYDACLIDCSPAIGLLAFNSLVAADEVLIPVETGFFALQGANKQINTIKSLGKRLGVAPVHRILATMHDTTSALAQDLLDELRRRFAGRVIPVVIRHDHALREAASFGQPVVEYSPESPGAADYNALADWLVEHSLSAAAGSTATRMHSAGGGGCAEQIAETPTSPPAESPKINVVPGIAQLALASSLHGQRRAEPAAAIVAEAAVITAPTQSNSSAEILAQTAASPRRSEPTISRAADLAARAKRLQPAVTVTVAEPPTEPIREPKPLRQAPHEPESSAQAQPATRLGPTHGTSAHAHGVHQTPEGILFRQPSTLGSRICIAGDFNSWTPETSPLKLNFQTGSLDAIVPISPGVYQYRLVVDGRWMPDPFNPVSAPNPFGGSNSLLTVHELRRDASPAMAWEAGSPA